MSRSGMTSKEGAKRILRWSSATARRSVCSQSIGTALENQSGKLGAGVGSKNALVEECKCQS